MRIFAVRHGQTSWNAEGRVQGRSDIPLNREGRRQALETAEKLAGLDAAIGTVITSPLRRARETAEIIAGHLGIGVEINDGLVERDFGDYEGRLLTEVDIDALRRWIDNVPTMNGETIRETASRVFRAMAVITERHKGNNMAIIAHGHVMRAIIWYFNGLPTEGEEPDFNVGNCEVFEFASYE